MSKTNNITNENRRAIRLFIELGNTIQKVHKQKATKLNVAIIKTIRKILATHSHVRNMYILAGDPNKRVLRKVRILEKYLNNKTGSMYTNGSNRLREQKS
jgi:hypothetical protein